MQFDSGITGIVLGHLLAHMSMILRHVYDGLTRGARCTPCIGSGQAVDGNEYDLSSPLP
jgi:hypothetical protein